MGMAELYQDITPTERVAVYLDDYPYSFEDITGDSLGVYTIRTARGYNEIKGGSLTDELDRLTRFLNHDQYESAIGKYLTLHDLHYKVVELRGYSQGEWATVMVYGDGAWIEGAAQDLNSWFRGDIYRLCHEEKVTYWNHRAESISRWEEIDSIGCLLINDTDDLLPLAQEHFKLSTQAA